MTTYTGELAALLTAFLWAFTAIFFTSASKRIGSFIVNMIRIPMALIIIATTLAFTTGRLFPHVDSSGQIYWLVASGIVGLVLGDTFLFRSFIILGPRLGSLIFASWPIMTAVISWFFLTEILSPTAIAGIAIASAGIVWVTNERKTEWQTEMVSADEGSKKLGVIYALLGAIGQSSGLVMAKYAMGETLEPLEASYVRMIAACIAIWIYGGLAGHLPAVVSAMRRGKAMMYALGGSISGPFLGIWMSLVAVKHAETGVAAAIMASVPMVIIPVTIFVYRQKPSGRAMAGAIVTAAGIALLFMR
ncbi:MAG: DMT family transporter [Candidatus Zixiibacteriota bacterium]